MLYALYVTGFFLAKILPVQICYFVAELVAYGFFIFGGKDREALRENLKVVFGGEINNSAVNKLVLNVFKNFAKYLVDFFKFPRFTSEYISKNIKIEGRQYLDECLREGKGVILLSLHLGNWELGAAIVGGLKYPITGIVLEHADKNINNFFVRQRAINNFKSIPLGIKIKECFRCLKNNEALAIVGDKDYTSTGIYADFFGRKAVMPKGPAVFSLKTGTPIVVTVMVREKDDTFKLCFEKPIKYAPSGNYDNDIKLLMHEYLKIFEKYIRENPDQWYAFRKIWNQE